MGPSPSTASPWRRAKSSIWVTSATIPTALTPSPGQFINGSVYGALCASAYRDIDAFTAQRDGALSAKSPATARY